MKLLSTLLLSIILSSNALAKCGFFHKPGGCGKNSVNHAVKKVSKATSQVAKEIKKTTDKAIHDTVKTVGDGVKIVRNAIAQMQGVNVEKTLKRLRRQIKECRAEDSKLNQAISEGDQLLKYLDEHKLEISQMSYKEVDKFVKKKIDSLRTFQQSVGQFSSAGSLLMSAGTGAYSTMQLSATTLASVKAVGAYCVAAGAVVLVMMDSVEKEIEHEQKKLNKCGKQYIKTYSKFATLLEQIHEKLMKDKQETSEVSEITKKYISFGLKLVDLEIANDRDSANIKHELKLLKSVLLDLINTFLNKYPDSVKKTSMELKKLELETIKF